jgi:hypothetical protein
MSDESQPTATVAVLIPKRPPDDPPTRIRFVSSMGVVERKKRISLPDSFRSNPTPRGVKEGNE